MDAITMTQNDFLDVLFDNRNKEYGAYSLRRQYERRMRNAIGITAAMLLALTATYTIGSMLANNLPATVAPVKPVAVLRPIEVETPAERKIQPPPPATVATPPAARPMIRNTTIAVVPDDTREITPPPTQAEMANHAIGTVNAVGDPNAGNIDVPDMGGTGGTGVVRVETGSNEGTMDRPFTTVEVMPSFPGGDAALSKFLNNNIRYPSMAQENNIQGIVAVQFVVAPDGTIQNVKVLNVPHGGGLEEEALRVIRKMPNWKPGRQNGRNVAVYFTLPVNFRMNEQ